MLKKISGLARALYIVLAIIAGFVALGTMNVALVLVVLGLIAGIAMPRERLVLALAAVIALPLLGAALTNIPMIGAQLNAVARAVERGAQPDERHDPLACPQLVAREGQDRVARGVYHRAP